MNYFLDADFCVKTNHPIAMVLRWAFTDLYKIKTNNAERVSSTLENIVIIISHQRSTLKFAFDRNKVFGFQT